MQQDGDDRGRTGPGGYRSAGVSTALRFEGEIWLADGIQLKSKAKRALLPFLLPFTASEPGLTALADKVMKLKAFPVSMRITMSHRDPRSDAPVGLRTVVSGTVSEISEEDLDDSLFKVPTDYSKENVH